MPMLKKNPSSVPYRSSKIHTFYQWIDRLPGPYWLYYLGLIAIAGLLNIIVAWNENILPVGEIDWYYALTAFLLSFYLFQIDFLFRIARETITELMPILDMQEDERERIRYEFTHLPAWPTFMVFLLGIGIGLGLGISIFPTAVEINQAFPELEIPVFTLSFGVGFIDIYMLIRAFKLTNRAYASLKTLDIFNLDSLYAISRYSVWLLIFVVSHAYLVYALTPTLVDFTFYFILSLSIGLLLLVSLTFWLPIRRVNRILILEKRRLMKDVNLRIINTFELLHTRIDQKTLERSFECQDAIQSLILEKGFIESLRTWPWKPGELTGLISVVVLPVLGGVLVEVVTRFFSP